MYFGGYCGLSECELCVFGKLCSPPQKKIIEAYGTDTSARVLNYVSEIMLSALSNISTKDFATSLTQFQFVYILGIISQLLEYLKGIHQNTGAGVKKHLDRHFPRHMSILSQPTTSNDSCDGLMSYQLS